MPISFQRSKNLPIIIVSGLPRSGTSMMMRMLKAGGMELMTDDIRTPDESNPNGYFEVEKIKKLKDDNSWIQECRGKAVKVVSPLLEHLPQNEFYKVIFMKRNLTEILASQREMIRQLHGHSPDQDDYDLTVRFQKHLDEMQIWLIKSDHIDFLEIYYDQVVAEPRSHAEIVKNFLAKELDVSEMAAAVDGSLYRQKSTKERIELTSSS